MDMCVQTRGYPLQLFLWYSSPWFCFTSIYLFSLSLSLCLYLCLFLCLCVSFSVSLSLSVSVYLSLSLSCGGMHAVSFFWRLEDNLEELVLLSHSVNSDNETLSGLAASRTPTESFCWLTIWRPGLSVGPLQGSLTRLTWLSKELWGSTHLHLPSTVITSILPGIWFFNDKNWYSLTS